MNPFQICPCKVMKHVKTVMRPSYMGDIRYVPTRKHARPTRRSSTAQLCSIIPPRLVQGPPKTSSCAVSRHLFDSERGRRVSRSVVRPIHGPRVAMIDGIYLYPSSPRRGGGGEGGWSW